MLKNAFEELAVERGETINILGMTVRMERAKGRAVIDQKRFVNNLITTYGVTKTAVIPATGGLMYEREDSKQLLEDQRKFMSLNATLMYASRRTFLEISFSVIYLSSHYNKATEDDYAKRR